MLWWWRVVVRHGREGVNEGGWWYRVCKGFSKVFWGKQADRRVLRREGTILWTRRSTRRVDEREGSI